MILINFVFSNKGSFAKFVILSEGGGVYDFVTLQIKLWNFSKSPYKVKNKLFQPGGIWAFLSLRILWTTPKWTQKKLWGQIRPIIKFKFEVKSKILVFDFASPKWEKIAILKKNGTSNFILDI